MVGRFTAPPVPICQVIYLLRSGWAVRKCGRPEFRQRPFQVAITSLLVGFDEFIVIVEEVELELMARNVGCTDGLEYHVLPPLRDGLVETEI